MRRAVFIISFMDCVFFYTSRAQEVTVRLPVVKTGSVARIESTQRDAWAA